MTTTPSEHLGLEPLLRLAQVPSFCDGTGAVVPETAVDGNHIATCPDCKRYREAFPIPDDGQRRYTIEAHFAQPRHRPAHQPYCYDDDGKLECACGLADVEAMLTEEQAARYQAGSQVFVDLGTEEAWT